MPKLIVPPPYQGPTAGVGDIPVEGSTVRECVEAADTKFPGFGAQILDEDGGLHRFVKVFVNGDLVRSDALDEAIAPDDQIEVLAAIAGG
jgi:sulfur carrier protein ThiS